METNNIELITRMVLQAIDKNEKKGDGFVVPIGVSARHIHLTQEHVEALFGPGYQLTKKKDLMGGQFRIYFFFPVMPDLKILKSFPHGIEDKFFKFSLSDFPTSRTALIFCPFCTAEISRTVRNMGCFQSISATPAFDFSGKPCIFGFAALLKGLIHH